MYCSKEEVREEVWAQLEAGLEDAGIDVLQEANVLAWFLDPAIVYPNPTTAMNLEPLLINTAGSWEDRPEAVTAIENLFLASDYVRTHTDLATMEGANEAARRAVNGILERTGSTQPRCPVWKLSEPAIFAPARALDRLLLRAPPPAPAAGPGRRRSDRGLRASPRWERPPSSRSRGSWADSARIGEGLAREAGREVVGDVRDRLAAVRERIGVEDSAREELVLAENVCFGCGEANERGLNISVYLDPDTPGVLHGEFRPGPDIIGVPGITHGGLVYTAMDCMATWSGMALKRTKAMWVLRSATTKYHRPALQGHPISLVASIEEEGGEWDAIDVRIDARNSEDALLVEGRFKVIPLPPEKFKELTGIDDLPRGWTEWLTDGAK